MCKTLRYQCSAIPNKKINSPFFKQENKKSKPKIESRDKQSSAAYATAIMQKENRENKQDRTNLDREIKTQSHEPHQGKDTTGT